MAANHNPFANWYASGGSNGGSVPSIVGALPYPHAPSYPLPPNDLVTFTFTNLNPTIVNCNVLGPNNRTYFLVKTDAEMPGYTVLKDNEQKNLALIEWQSSPLLEVRGVVGKQKVCDWIRLASDRSHRTMEIRGQKYVLAPYNGHVCLYSTGSSANRTLARMGKVFNVNVVLEMHPDAMQLGLLDVCVLITVLLNSGRNID